MVTDPIGRRSLDDVRANGAAGVLALRLTEMRRETLAVRRVEVPSVDQGAGSSRVRKARGGKSRVEVPGQIVPSCGGQSMAESTGRFDEHDGDGFAAGVDGVTVSGGGHPGSEKATAAVAG